MAVVENNTPFQVPCPNESHTILEPFAVFEPTGESSGALVILNTNLYRIALRDIWRHSLVRVCADGGANRLYDFFDSENEREKYLPDYITGDCDSLRADVEKYYVSRGTILIRQMSQYSTDFMKAIIVALLHTSGESGRRALAGPIESNNGLSDLMSEVCPLPEISLYVAGGIGGRFDQLFHLINQLYTLTKEYPGMAIFFYTETDVIFLIPKGVNYVKYSSVLIFNTLELLPRCGLLPFGKNVILNTRGLQFDVENWPSTVGGDVSTSNGILGKDGFVICTSEDIVLSVEVSR